MNKTILRSIILLLVANFLFILSISVYRNSFYVENQKSEVSVQGPGEWLLVDSYDSKTSSFQDFFHGKNAYSIMENTIAALKTTFQQDYHQVSTQDIAYVGNYVGETSCVNGEKDSVNQLISSQKITPLYSLQTSKTFYNQKGFKEMVQNGKSFCSNDFNVNGNDVIPIIIGSKYKKILSIGDVFTGKFLGEVDLKYKVIGILKDNAEITLRGEKIALNSYLITPALQISKVSKGLGSFNKTLLAVKCEGYLSYKDNSDLESKFRKLMKIREKTGFQYEIPVPEINYNELLYTNMNLALLLCLATFIILCYSFYTYTKYFIQKHHLVKMIIPYIGITLADIFILYMMSVGLNRKAMLVDNIRSAVIYSFVLFIGIILIQTYKTKKEGK
ncbi:MAG: hypothetical protein PHD70_09850 [Anaerostipes sp.]|nr:hypothetical protein [Anaerostipes sp.]